jgi:hypothetical protein
VILAIFGIAYPTISQSVNRRLRTSSGILKESHEAEIHVEILVAVKQGEPGIIGYEIDINSAVALGEDGVFENSGRFFPMNFRDLEIVPVQVERMHVVALVDESESITATLMNLDRLALIVRLAIDRPHVESFLASVDFSNFHRNYFVWRDR